MNIQLDHNQNSFFDQTKFYARNFLDSARKSAFPIYPLAPLGLVVDSLLSFKHLCPSVYYSDPDYEDPENEEYLISSEQDQAHFINLYKNFCIKAFGNREFEKQCKDAIIPFIEKAILETKELIEEFNRKLNMSIQLCVSSSESMSYCPFYAVGGTLTSPLIKMEFPTLEIQIPEVEDEKQKALKVNVGYFPMSKEEKQFCLAHEVSHLKNNDPILSSIWNIATSAIACLPWAMNYSDSSSWSSYLALSSIESWVIKTASIFAFSFIARNVEKRADLDALKELGDNKGAVEFFSSCVDGSNLQREGYFHPSNRDRLRYCQEWKPESI